MPLICAQAYLLEVLPHPSLRHTFTEFIVANQPFRVDLVLERAIGCVTAVFRSAVSPSAASASARHGAVQWTDALTLPKGMRYEVSHKGSGAIVCSGEIERSERSPSISIDSSQLYVLEAYTLRVLATPGIHPTSCEFVVESTEKQEVSVLIRRSSAQLAVSFHSIEFDSTHWAASLVLPPAVRFQLVHRESGAVVFSGDAGPSNYVAIPPSVVYTGCAVHVHRSHGEALFP